LDLREGNRPGSERRLPNAPKRKRARESGARFRPERGGKRNIGPSAKKSKPGAAKGQKGEKSRREEEKGVLKP